MLARGQLRAARARRLQRLRSTSTRLSRDGVAQPVAARDAGKAKAFVNCGVPLPGYEVEIRDEARPAAAGAALRPHLSCAARA